MKSSETKNLIQSETADDFLIPEEKHEEIRKEYRNRQLNEIVSEKAKAPKKLKLFINGLKNFINLRSQIWVMKDKNLNPLFIRLVFNTFYKELIEDCCQTEWFHSNQKGEIPNDLKKRAELKIEILKAVCSGILKTNSFWKEAFENNLRQVQDIIRNLFRSNHLLDYVSGRKETIAKKLKELRNLKRGYLTQSKNEKISKKVYANLDGKLFSLVVDESRIPYNALDKGDFHLINKIEDPKKTLEVVEDIINMLDSERKSLKNTSVSQKGGKGLSLIQTFLARELHKQLKSEWFFIGDSEIFKGQEIKTYSFIKKFTGKRLPHSYFRDET